MVPNKLAQLISPLPSDLPPYEDLWEQNQHEATDGLVREYFSPLCCSQSELFRRFIICHTFDKAAWKEKYAHIAAVVNPADCIETYIKPRKG